MDAERIRQKLEEELSRCVRCGACRHLCPVFNAENTEESSPRGKNTLLIHLLHEDFGSPDIERLLNSCTLCEACTKGCPNEVHTFRIVMYGRILTKNNPLEKTALRAFNKNRLLELGQKAGSRIQSLFRGEDSNLTALTLRLGDMEKQIPSIPRNNFFDMYRLLPDQDKFPRKVLFFVGCLIRYLYPRTGIHLIEILNRYGWGVIAPEEQVCCGLPSISSGHLEPFIESMRLNIETFNKYDDIPHILSACGSCGNTLQNMYPEFSEDADIPPEEIRRFSGRITDVSQFLVEELKLVDIHGNGSRKVTYHDSCHLARGMGIREAPRILLEQTSRFLELPESDVCCGFGGSFSVKEWNTSQEILKRKMENVESTGADTLLAGCPGCVLQLQEGSRKYVNDEIEVKHIIDFLYEEIILKSG